MPLAVVVLRSAAAAFTPLLRPFPALVRWLLRRPLLRTVTGGAPAVATDDTATSAPAAANGNPLLRAWCWLATRAPTPWSDVNRKCASALLMALLLGGCGRFVMVFLGEPHAPIRGVIVRTLDPILMLSSVLALLWLVFLVIEAARQFVALCRAAERTMPAADARLQNAEAWRAQRRFLVDLATAGGKGIYGPFIVILLLCLSRWQGFDAWTWPLGLKVVVVTAGLCVLLAHVHLHHVAVRLRDHSVRTIELAREDIADKDLDNKLANVLRDLKQLDHGIFAGLTGHPVMRGLVIPFTGIGGVSVLQWLQAV